MHEYVGRSGLWWVGIPAGRSIGQPFGCPALTREGDLLLAVHTQVELRAEESSQPENH
jgi:hypothetical protein